MHRTESDGNGWNADEECVQRTLDVDWATVEALLADADAMRTLPMHFDETFEQVDRLIDIWRATGRIERHLHVEHIELEVIQTSDSSAEMRVLPWREHHHFIHLSHQREHLMLELADHLEALLTGAPLDLNRRSDTFTA